MDSENEPHASIRGQRLPPDPRSFYLQKFKLYETQSNFYMIGTDKTRTFWRVLKIDRLESSELNISEDATTYSESECAELMRRMHEGNKSTGGLKFVINCYGIVGFIKFLGPYYMLLIAKRRRIGAICGHSIYAVTKSEMIALQHSSMHSNMANSMNENRYKKLLCTVDLTKDFFFSYSYHVMCSLQKNLCDDETGQVLYETMFVWNEFLTRGIRHNVKNTLWTVALVYGFFKQAKLSISGKDFKLTLIARRSRHYAGTRYLKRGVNEKGRVANDVETEQIVFEDVPEGCPMQMTSVVQNRGSIPLFWSQETSRLNLKPDIILQKKDRNYEATRLHFENLMKRYGNPIIILNLIKAHEKRPRESILRVEFSNAIDHINRDLSEENRLKYVHWDLHKLCRSKATNVLCLLGKVATFALSLTGFLYCQVSPTMRLEGALEGKIPEKYDVDDTSEIPCNTNIGDDSLSEIQCKTNKGDDSLSEIQCNTTTGDDGISEAETLQDSADVNDNYLGKPRMFQKGVLRTNCIDCLDRTNVAQYAYGLAALGNQLHALGYIDVPSIDLDAPLADDLMRFYETMGDTLAFQYGGSAAHNKIFSQRRGQWKAATQSQEFFRTLQRYYSNAYMDAEKQDAINVFLGHFQPPQGIPPIWELDSDQHYGVGTHGFNFASESARSLFKRSLSDGNILQENNTPVAGGNIGQKKLPSSALTEKMLKAGANHGHCDSTPDISTCESDISYSRYTPSMVSRELFVDTPKDQLESDHIYFCENGSGDSNFLDLDWLSSSGNSCEEEIYERSAIFSSPATSLSSENVINGSSKGANLLPPKENGSCKGRIEAGVSYHKARNSDNPSEFSDRFVQWVIHGETIC